MSVLSTALYDLKLNNSIRDFVVDTLVYVNMNKLSEMLTLKSKWVLFIFIFRLNVKI